MMTARVTAGSPIPVAAPVPLFHIANELLRVEYAFYLPAAIPCIARSERRRTSQRRHPGSEY
jgi:hypothetical protein